MVLVKVTGVAVAVAVELQVVHSFPSRVFGSPEYVTCSILTGMIVFIPHLPPKVKFAGLVEPPPLSTYSLPLNKP